MTLLILHPSVRLSDLEAKFSRMGFIPINNQYCHFTGVILSIVEDHNNLFLKVDNSPYEIDELIDYFYLRNLTKKILRDKKMAISSVYLLPNSLPTTLKDTIIFLLSEQWPLSIKQIHQFVLWRFSRPISYQAIHKALGQLYGEGIMTRSDNRYKLNPDWLKSLNSFLKTVIQEYESHPNYPLTSLRTSDTNYLPTSIDQCELATSTSAYLKKWGGK